MIRVGDRVRDWEGDECDVLAIAGDEAAVLFPPPINMAIMQLADLTPITRTPEPAPAPLTGAQVAQVFDRLRHYLVQVAGEQPGFGLGDLVRVLRFGAERERDNAG